MIKFTPPPGLSLESVEQEPDCTWIVCRVPEPPEGWACPSCSATGQKYGGAPRTLYDLPRGGKRVVIHWYQPRVRCVPCGSTFRPAVAGISADHPRLSARLVAWVAEQLRAGLALKAVAKEARLSTQTVWLVARSQGVELPPQGRPKAV